MAATSIVRRRLVCSLVLGLALVACAPVGPQASRDRGSGGASGQSEQRQGRKVLNLGLRTILDGFAISAAATLAGGGMSYIEIHSQALFTADQTTGRPIPRLLTELPTLENGGLRITPDGRMTSTYKVRPDVKWADGAPLTSRDLMFTFAVSQNRSVPIVDPGPSELMESADAPDDYTFAITWKQPYYQADALGLTPFWPLPAHLLERDYQTLVVDQKDIQAFLTRPYWTAEYIHVGPFKLVDFQPGVEATFDAVDNYFLGRPKVDRIIVKQFADVNTVLANFLSGSLDLSTDNVLLIEQSMQLKDRWDPENGGAIKLVNGPTFFVSFQFDPATPGFQPIVLDRRVRQGLYLAVDRDAYAEAVLAGVPDKGAHSMLSPQHALYAFVKDAWKTRYPYDPSRAVATLEENGFRRGADGVLTHPTMGRLSLDARVPTGQERKLTVVADMWRRVGAEVDESVIPAARIRDREYRQTYRGLEVTARGNDDVLLTRLECAAGPTAQNKYTGSNRGHWCNSDFDHLVNQYRATLREDGRGPLIKQIQDIMLDELPIQLLNYEVTTVVARRGVTAFRDDFEGGADSGRIYGTYSRNAHEWDIIGA